MSTATKCRMLGRLNACELVRLPASAIRDWWAAMGERPMLVFTVSDIRYRLIPARPAA